LRKPLTTSNSHKTSKNPAYRPDGGYVFGKKKRLNQTDGEVLDISASQAQGSPAPRWPRHGPHERPSGHSPFPPDRCNALWARAQAAATDFGFNNRYT